MNTSTPISEFTMNGRTFYVKRDDLFDPFLSGNKFRKLHSFLYDDSKSYSQVISYGGTQSNAMLAIAALSKKKSWDYYYYTKPLSEYEKNLEFGNLYLAKSLGMKHVEIDQDLYKQYVSSLRVNLSEDTLLIHQGGADTLAQNGLEVLACEIKDTNIPVTSIALPSGTGTSALYLALALPEYTIYTVACIGDDEYLKKQMSALDEIPSNLVILTPNTKYHFAKPYKEFYEIYSQLLKCSGIEFDLLYSPLMWKMIIESLNEDILYVHTGGITGNKSMIERYKRKGFV